ncbi:MAG: DUF192 domain-containing protein [Raoultibacter sp.]
MSEEESAAHCTERVCVPNPIQEVRVPAMRIKLALTFGERLRGLYGSVPDDAVMLLVPCRDIHTFGMSYSLDAAFIDKQGTVLLAVRDVPKGKRVTCPGAYAVFERASNPLQPWLKTGQSAALFLGQDALSVLAGMQHA